MVNVLIMNFIEYYINQYQKARPWDLPDFVFDIKDRAMEKLSTMSFPSSKDEAYRYTNVAQALEKEMTIYRPSNKDFGTEKIKKILNSDIPEIDSYSIALNNGYHLHNEPIHKLPGGVILGSFVSVVKQFESIYRDFASKYEPSDDVLVNLNTMLSGDGFFVFVPAGFKPAKPIQITSLFDGSNGALIQPHNLIIMEPGSSADVFVCDYTLSDGSFVCNDVTEVVLGKSASLNLVRMQKANDATSLITHTIVRQSASSRMKTHYLSLSGASIRNNLTVTLAGKHAEHTAKGLSFTRKTEHADNQILIIHASPDCHSNQLFKHILSDTSTGVFTGRIVVAKDAQKTLAYQRSSNILLDPKAKMNIRPQLEIYADDVKCSHGATVGQLDAEALFYLRSRGIGEIEAKKLLLQAFAGEILEDIECELLKKEMMKTVEQKMKDNF